MSDSAAKIREFLQNNAGVDVNSVSDEDPLFTSGLVDSFALIELLAFLENELNAQVDVSELGIDELDTISSLSKLVG